MRLTALLITGCIFCVSATSALSAEVTSLDQYLPSDLVIYAGIDIAALLENDESTKVDELLEHAGMKKQLDDFNRWWDDNVTKDFHLFDEDLLGEGAVAVGVQFEIGGTDGAPQESPKLQVITLCEDPEGTTFQRIVDALKENIINRKTLGVLGFKMGGKTVGGNPAVFMSSPTLPMLSLGLTKDGDKGVTAITLGFGMPVEDYITAFAEGTLETNITKSTVHRNSIASAQRDESFVHVWADFPELIETGLKVLKSLPIPQDKVDIVLDRLGVKDIGLFSADMAYVDGVADTHTLLRVHGGKPTGLLDLFLRPIGEDAYRYAPKENAFFAACGHAPIKEIVHFVVETIGEVTGEDAMADYREALAGAKEETGLDIEAEVMDTIGTDAVAVCTKSGYAVALTLEDTATFTASLEKLLTDNELPLQTLTYKGMTYRTIPFPLMPGIQPTFGVIGDALVIGSSAQSWKESVETYESETSVTDVAWFKDQILSKGKDFVWLNYYDANGYINTFNFQAMVGKQALAMQQAMGVPAGGAGAMGGVVEPIDITFEAGAFPEGAGAYWTHKGLEGRAASSAFLSGFFNMTSAAKQIAATAAKDDEGSLSRRAREREAEETRAGRVGTGDTEEDIELIALACEGFYKKRGRYPQSLEALVPDFLKGVPVDPNSAGTPYRYYSNELVYFIVAGNSPDGDADINVRSYRGAMENDRAVQGKIYDSESGSLDGDIAIFGPKF